MNIQIIVGSVMGGAEEVADLAAAQLIKKGFDVRVNTSFSVEDLNNPDEIILLCHSNTGAGDLPDNIIPLYLHLTRDFPRIAGRRYGVINLGDSSYSSFNEGGRMLDEAMADLGAAKIGESLVFDASEDQDKNAELTAWVEQFSSQL